MTDNNNNNNNNSNDNTTKGADVQIARETPQETASRVHEFCDYHRLALEQSLADM